MEITMNEKTDRQGVESGIEIGKWNMRHLIFYCFFEEAARRASRKNGGPMKLSLGTKDLTEWLRMHQAHSTVQFEERPDEIS